MDSGTTTATPEDERLTQEECLWLFGPSLGDTV